MKTLVAIFPKTRHTKRYIIRPGDEPEVGDQIITSYSGIPGEYSGDSMIATVKSTDPSEATLSRAILKPYLLWIPSKVLFDRTEESRRIVAAETEKETLRNQLDSLLTNEALIDRYARLADRNPAARVLLDKLIALEGNQVTEPLSTKEVADSLVDLVDGKWHEEKPHHAGLKWPMVERQVVLSNPSVKQIRMINWVF